MRSRHGFILEVTVSDGDDEIVLTFFLTKQHQFQWHRGRLAVGARIIVHGTVGFDGYRQALPDHPPRLRAGRGHRRGRAGPSGRAARLSIAADIAQATMRSATEKGLEFAGSLSRPVPDEVIARRAVAPLEEAVRLVHTPLTVENTRHGMAHLPLRGGLHPATDLRPSAGARTSARPHRSSPPRDRPRAVRCAPALHSHRRPARDRWRDRGASSATAIPPLRCCRAMSGPARPSSLCAPCSRAVDSGHQAALLARHRGACRAAPPHPAHPARRSRAGRSARRARGGDPGAPAHRVPAHRRSPGDCFLDVTFGTGRVVVGTHSLLTESWWSSPRWAWW